MATQPTIRLDIRQTAPLNTWIAISADETRIVAMGKTVREVSDKCRKAGETDVSLFLTPRAWDSMCFQAW